MLIARVMRPGEVLLIGPGSAARLSEVLNGLEELGARLCLVDGSFDRLAAASPQVTDQVIVAAGAAFSPNLAETVTQVNHLMDVLDLPAISPDLDTAVRESLRRWPVGIVTSDGTVQEVPVATTLGEPAPAVAAAARLEEQGAALVIRGALGDRLVQSLLSARASRLAVIVPDATHVMVERNLWRRWRRMGGQARVVRTIRVAAVTTNPHSPIGADYDPVAFHGAVCAAVARPVFDLEAGLVSARQR